METVAADDVVAEVLIVAACNRDKVNLRKHPRKVVVLYIKSTVKKPFTVCERTHARGLISKLLHRKIRISETDPSLTTHSLILTLIL